MTNSYKGILFDFDGVLVCTMEDNFTSWRKALSDYGVEIKPEEYLPLEGMSVYKIAERFIEQYGLASEIVSRIVKKKEESYIKIAGTKTIAFYPGVVEMVNKLYQYDVPIAIVTGGLRDRLQKTVPDSFLRLFRVLITNDMTGYGKPSPDPYLKGAELLGLDPSECIGIENAPLGIEAVKSAEMYCIAISSTMDPACLKSADEIVDSFINLRDLEIIRGLF